MEEKDFKTTYTFTSEAQQEDNPLSVGGEMYHSYTFRKPITVTNNQVYNVTMRGDEATARLDIFKTILRTISSFWFYKIKRKIKWKQ